MRALHGLFGQMIGREWTWWQAKGARPWVLLLEVVFAYVHSAEADSSRAIGETGHALIRQLRRLP